MRMIGIGLLAFLVLGAALTLSYMEVWTRSWRAVEEAFSGPQLVFEPAFQPKSAVTDQVGIFTRAHPDNAIILSGFPAYQGAFFPIPIDARPTSGYLQIDATFQSLTGSGGALRVSINNTRRAEVLLRPGEVARSLQIILTPPDLVGKRLVVSFSLHGEGTRTPCGQDDAVDAIVEIEPTSGLFLRLDKPLLSLRDRIASWGQQVRIGWPKGLGSVSRVKRLALAAELERSGLKAVLIASPELDVLSDSELVEAPKLWGEHAGDHPTSFQVWPAAIAEKGSNAGARRFFRSNTWRIRYDLQDYENQLIPERLELRMTLGPLAGSANWVVSVTLNGRVLDASTVPGSTTLYASDIELPIEHHDLINLIEVNVSSTYDPSGLCNDGPELLAEIRPDSLLVASTTAFNVPLVQLRKKLESTNGVQLRVGGGISAIDAQDAAEVLATIVPQGAQLSTAKQDVSALVVGHDKEPLTAMLEAPQIAETWAVYRSSSDQSFVVAKLDAVADSEPVFAAPVVVLLSFQKVSQ